MSRLRWRWIWVWTVGALAACATTQPSEIEVTGSGDEVPAVPFEELCSEEHSLLLLCDASKCGLYRCHEVMEHVVVGRVVPTRGGALPLPSVQGAQRYWGSAQDLPQDTRPVFIIPWGPQAAASAQSDCDARGGGEGAERAAREASHLPKGFQGVVRPARHQYRRVRHPARSEEAPEHSPRGEWRPWNEAWWKFIQKHKEGVTKEEIHRYAGQLIYEFQLFGPVVPYWKQPPPLPRGY